MTVNILGKSNLLKVNQKPFIQRGLLKFINVKKFDKFYEDWLILIKVCNRWQHTELKILKRHIFPLRLRLINFYELCINHIVISVSENDLDLIYTYVSCKYFFIFVIIFLQINRLCFAKNYFTRHVRDMGCNKGSLTVKPELLIHFILDCYILIQRLNQSRCKINRY